MGPLKNDSRTLDFWQSVLPHAPLIRALYSFNGPGKYALKSTSGYWMEKLRSLWKSHSRDRQHHFKATYSGSFENSREHEVGWIWTCTERELTIISRSLYLGICSIYRIIRKVTQERSGKQAISIITALSNIHDVSGMAQGTPSATGPKRSHM